MLCLAPDRHRHSVVKRPHWVKMRDYPDVSRTQDVMAAKTKEP